MSNIVTDKIKPDEASADKLTIGGTGDSVVILDSLNLNQLQDTGGNSLFVSDGSGTITSKNSGLAGGMNLISTQTASGSASISFTSGLDSTYDVYMFKWIEINPTSDGAYFGFQTSSDGGSSYAMTITSTAFRARNEEDGSSPDLIYETEFDRAQQTILQPLLGHLGDGSDESSSGELHLFSPSSSTYVKHFYSTENHVNHSAPTQTQNYFIGGYVNSTDDIDAITFKMSAGNFDGVIKLYGISKS
tara:strand:- start:982 stop:1719 length:738 start_codon:yes stop_codon:yes gene_type:complete